jgi:ketol-acid reductoisomerase
LIMILAPDQVQGKIYEQSVKDGLTAGKTLLFAHGFSVRFGFVSPPKDVNVVMVAPKAPGHRFRELFQEGAGVPGLVAVEQDATGNAKEIALAYAKGLGLTRAGVIETTFKEECETDLFGEQAVLCGGITEMIQAGFQTLVRAGYQPEIAYFECLHEVKLIVDQIYENGISYMLYSVSDTAEYGAYYAGPKVIDAHVRQSMQELLDRVQDGTFAKQWMAENESGREHFLQMRADSQNSQIEQVGKGLRAMMPWLQKGKTPVDISA